MEEKRLELWQSKERGVRCIVTAREEEKKGCKREERQVKQKVVNYKEVSLRGDDNNVMSL